MKYEPTPKKQYKKVTKIDIISGEEKENEMNKQTLKGTLKVHNKEIKKLKSEIKRLRLLKKQARTTYKLTTV